MTTMTETPESGDPSQRERADERAAPTGRWRKALRRPEIGSVAAALVVFAFFSLATGDFLSSGGMATWLASASMFGIMAVAVSMLMIGGEFDLSTGAMTGSTGLVVGVLCTEYGLNIWLSVVLALVFALTIGAVNGWLVMRTGLPSFIVTLGTFFVLQGVNLAVTKLLTGSVAIQGMGDVPGYYQLTWLFGSTVEIGPLSLQISVLWWLVFTAAATWVLLRTRAGNWVFAVGGDQGSARQMGVPVARTKTALFMTTAGAGWAVGMLSLFSTSTVQASTGVGQEFVYIICAVVGGCLLTGGFGSAVGGALGALIYGMTYQGIIYAGWDNNWLYAFLGVMLLAAVLVNNGIRKRAEVAR